MDRGAWWGAGHAVTQSQMLPKPLSTDSSPLILSTCLVFLCCLFAVINYCV